MNELHSGSCHCGHIRYQFSGALRDIAHCHFSTSKETT